MTVSILVAPVGITRWYWLIAVVCHGRHANRCSFAYRSPPDSWYSARTVAELRSDTRCTTSRGTRSRSTCMTSYRYGLSTVPVSVTRTLPRAIAAASAAPSAGRTVATGTARPVSSAAAVTPYVGNVSSTSTAPASFAASAIAM